MEEKNKRFNDAVAYLISTGEINGKSPARSIGERLGRNYSNVSNALRGEERFITERFIKHFCSTYKVISAEWVLYGKGQMLKQDAGTITTPISDESLMSLSRNELVYLVKQLMLLNKEQVEMYRLLIRQNEEMIRNSQERFNNISSIIYKNVQ